MAGGGTRLPTPAPRPSAMKEWLTAAGISLARREGSRSRRLNIQPHWAQLTVSVVADKKPNLLVLTFVRSMR